MPCCDGGGGLPTYIAFIYLITYISTHFIHLIDRYQKNIFGEPYLGVVGTEVYVRAR
jgi:hypothetical protein